MLHHSNPATIIYQIMIPVWRRGKCGRERGRGEGGALGVMGANHRLGMLGVWGGDAVTVW